VAPVRSGRPGLYQEGVRPRPDSNPRPPWGGDRNGSGWNKRHHHGHGHDHDDDDDDDHWFYGYYGFGYGFFPYNGAFGADDYYYFGRYRDAREEEERWPDSRGGNVQLRVEPRDVQVYVDGVLTARDGRATLSLPSGRWRLEFVRPGYRTETIDIEVIQGVSLRVERRLERLSGADVEDREFSLTDTGELQVDIRPDDAIVYLDGRALGLASHLRDLPALRRLAPGRHVIEARRPGYAPLRQEVVVSPVQPAVVRGELAPERE
jgi:hypothetical protein